MSATGRSLRAPALYVTATSAPDSPPLSFRLPCPPAWDDRPPAVRAAERRARKAYFATLDALYRGQVNEDAAGKLRRLVSDVRSMVARHALEHLLRVLGFVRRTEQDGAVLVPPATPCARVTIGVPLAAWRAGQDTLAVRYAWPIEWLTMHRFVVGKGLVIDWHPLPESVGGSLTPTRALAAVHRRRLRGAA